MRKLLMFLLLLPALAWAHPEDDLCVPPKDSDDGCQPAVHALMFDNDLFHAAVKSFQHCKRLLVAEDTVRMAECVGSNRLLSAMLRKNYNIPANQLAFLSYWEVIPSYPELDKLDTGSVFLNVLQASQQIAACLLTRAVVSQEIDKCETQQASLYRECRRRRYCR